MTRTRPILTIGHSRHSFERFAALLAGAGVETLADIRSMPRSRFSPHFNKDALAAALAARNVAYVFLGKELGGRPQDPQMYSGGVADYEKMAASSEFRLGLAQLSEAAAERTLAMLCSEADPLECHRFLLVGRALAEGGSDVRHILPSGDVMTHRQAEDRLLELEGFAERGLPLLAPDARLAEAYRARSRKAAYRAP
jgi:uncharacterized protein (DUF488 family)